MAKKKEEVKEVKKPEPRDVKATAKTVRCTSRKAKLVLDIIRGKDAKQAMGILKLTPNYAAEVTLKVVKSAVANATHNFQMDEDKLYIKECYANEGFTIKRYMPRAKGSAGSIMKRKQEIVIRKNRRKE